MIRISLAEARVFWKIYSKNKGAVVGLGLVFIFGAFAVSAPLISPYDPLAILVGPALQPPSNQFILGTDDLGRDVLSQFFHGAQLSLLVGFLAALTSSLVGITIGAIAGYFGGLVDEILMRLTEGFLVLPAFFVALLFLSIYGPSVWLIIMVIGGLNWPPVSRIIRAEFLSIKEREFVESARVIHASNFHIIVKEILPNALPPAIVASTLVVGIAILAEASLSFLGLTDPSTASWGQMLFRSQGYLRVAWWLFIFPCIGIFCTVLGINLVGDGLNDALNPKLKER